MIVFYLFLSLILIIILLLFSVITIDINKAEIENVEMLKNIYLVINEKKYEKIFCYINMEVRVKILLFSLIPIVVIKINNKKAKKIIHSLIIQDLKDKRKNPVKHELKREKQKQQLKKIKKKINSHVKIKDADFTLMLGLTNAGVTAIVTAFLNAVISIMLLEYISDMFEKQSEKTAKHQLSNMVKNLNYVVKPIYNDDFAFSLKTNIKLKIPIHALI